jgi:pyruvate/2-oxoglutarate dehydrogenase complex dihydrolipoamide acyltransferase (E2) component
MPIMLGIVALLLLGLLGVGVWLISQSRDGTAPAATTPPAAPTTTSAAPTPTTAAPTTGEPTPTAPRSVTVPSLIGLSSAQARGALDELGLTYRLMYRASDVPDGTVIETDPPAGQEVPEGAQVTLVIATPPATSAAPGGSGTPPPTG